MSVSRTIIAALCLLLTALGTSAVTTSLAIAQTTTAEPAGSASGEAETAKPKSILAGRDEAQPARGWYGQAMAWLQRQQQSLNRTLAASVRDLKAQGSLAAALVLAGISFLYGVLHAAGPGHGKAIISSYAVASAETIRRSITLSFMAAFFQALSAIALVLILALALKSTGLEIQQFSRRLEQVSFALIAIFGLWLLVTALRRYVFAPARPALAGHHHHHEHHHHHDHHDHAHDHGSHHGHAHIPEPKDLAGPWSWRRSIAIAAAVGIRPCSGAIILLIFALTQGMLWAGIAGTFAMALGTAITVAVLAVLAVGTRQLAERASGERMGRIVEAVAGVGGALLVLGLGGVFFLASLGPAPPL